MSADNGVYILETKGPEFRVAYAQGIDNIYGNFNDDTGHWDGDDEAMQFLFKDALVYDDLDVALDKAHEIADNYEYLEYGICILADFRNKHFNQE